MGSESLQARLTAAGLRRVANDIIQLSMPSIRLHCQRTNDQTALPLGNSRLGGRPDLPSGKNWPAWQGYPMAFVGQINLADIAAHDAEGHLPHSGLLSFFCAVDGTAAGVMRSLGDPSSWRVSYFDGDPATLVQLPLPPDLPTRLHFPGCQASFSREPTLPDVHSRGIRSLGLSEPERSAYIDVTQGGDVNFVGVFNHHLLGYPYILNESPFVAGYLKAHGVADPYAINPYAINGVSNEELQHRLQLPSLPDKWRDRQDLLEDKADMEWRLLMQVYSNEEAEMDWAGGGVLHFCIPREALSWRDFDRVWVEMQFV
jgi:uncharacterized protein YwqG